MAEEKNIELSIGAAKIPAFLFKRKVNAFLDLLDQVTDAITKGEQKIRWDVAVESGSQIIRAYPITKNKILEDTILETMDNGQMEDSLNIFRKEH